MVTKAELEKKHGNPASFAKAVEKARDDLFITQDEAELAIRLYQIEWDNAEPSQD